MGRRMIVWDGGGNFWRPDEIVEHVFKVADEYSPVMIGVEEDGLNEFLMQPLRHEQAKRADFIPIVPFKAPKDRSKHSFISALQPYFNAGEIVFSKDLPELQAQFLNFPTGRIDGPNALAYSMRMQPGHVVYSDFSAGHVVESIRYRRRVPLFLCLNATLGCTTGVLVQYAEGVLSIYADFISEGDPGEALSRMVQAANLEVPGGEIRLVGGSRHFADYDAVGLVGAVARLPGELQRGGAETMGRDELRALLARSVRGDPAVAVASRARWVINGFCAGYARETDKGGLIREAARPGVYRLLFEGLEAFTALLNTGMMEDRGTPNVQYTPSGQRWISALPTGRGFGNAKGDWGVSTLAGRSLVARPER